MQAQEKIRAWLKSEKRSQRWLAGEVQTTEETVSRWLSGAMTPAPISRRLLSLLSGQDVNSEQDWMEEADTTRCSLSRETG